MKEKEKKRCCKLRRLSLVQKTASETCTESPQRFEMAGWLAGGCFAESQTKIRECDQYVYCKVHSKLNTAKYQT